MSELVTIKSKLKSVNLLSYVSSILLVVALCLGLYTRWLHSDDIAILLIAFLGLFVFSLAIALVYYFSLESVGFSLLRLWVGCLLGIIMFTEPAVFDDGLVQTTQEITNSILISSVCVRCLWCLVCRLLHVSIHEFYLISGTDLLEMVGLVIASLVVGQDFVAVTLLIAGLFLAITAVRLKSFLGLLNVVFVVAFANVRFFRLLNISLNSYAFLCFVGRLSFEPVIDLYFVGLTVLERWNGLLTARPALRRLVLIGVLAAELVFLAVHSIVIRHHKEWYVVVPIFSVLVVFWVSVHLAFFVTCWSFSNKITECIYVVRDLSADNRNLRRIMASRGLRCFCLIARRVACVTLLSTNLVAIVAWETKSALSVGMWFLVLPLEVCFLGLLWNLGAVLGGTCVGYTVVVPTLSLRSEQKTTVLPPSFVKDVQARSTQILSALQSFFTFHLIDPFGLDYCSSGLSLDTLESKLRQFFQRSTPDGPRFDTYIVYYSGPVDENGDWALTGDDRLKLDRLLEWWKVLNPDRESRLLIVLDAENSHRWVRRIASERQLYVAIQTWQPSKVSTLDSELGSIATVGAFTLDWVNYNCGDASKVDWRDRVRFTRGIYAVSRSWTDFQFRSPTDLDVAYYWNANFPQASKLLIRLTSGPRFCFRCACSDCILRCLRRKKMKWLPPLEYDTGHGFKLVHSFF